MYKLGDDGEDCCILINWGIIYKLEKINKLDKLDKLRKIASDGGTPLPRHNPINRIPHPLRLIL